MLSEKRKQLPIIGWREWVSLPDLGIKSIKVKVDTGARSSSLHAFDLREFDRDGELWVRFKVHPVQRNTKRTILAEAQILEKRSVRSSSGKAVMRPVIATKIKLLGNIFVAEVTLANRDEMGFRMLLGRERFEIASWLMLADRITAEAKTENEEAVLTQLTEIQTSI